MFSLESFIWRPYAVDLQNWNQPSYYQDSEQIISDSLVLDDDLQSFVRFIAPCELNGLGCKAEYHPHRVAMQFGFDQDIPGDDLSSYKSCKFGKFFVPSRSFQPGVSKRYYDWWKSVDRMGVENEQDSWLGERVNTSVECGKFEEENCDKKCDSEYVEDEFDDILVSLKKICNATKRKIDALKESCVGVTQSKKEKLGSGLGNEASGIIIVD
ncbi:putative aminotransferase-like, plant mobile domain-containing protein [Helianthus anomalus]